MPDLSFVVQGAEAVRDAISPTVAIDLEITNRSGDEPVDLVVLRAGIRIETQGHRYTAEEQPRLRNLFGEPARWSQTLRPLLWASLTATVPAFRGRTRITLLIPCTFDLEFTVSQYFHGLDGGTVPLNFVFSGTVFHRTADAGLQAAPISWNSEARYVFPVAIWKECIDIHYPNTAWLPLRRDVLGRLNEFKLRGGLATFDEAIELMIEPAREAGV